MPKNQPAHEMLLNRWWRSKENVHRTYHTSRLNEAMAEAAVGQLSAINTYREVVGYVKSF